MFPVGKPHFARGPQTSLLMAKPEDILKILVVSDLHLGFNERDAIRGQDTFNTFEEVASRAVGRHELAACGRCGGAGASAVPGRARTWRVIQAPPVG